MNTLSPESVDDVLGRFYSCNDGVIRGVKVSYRTSARAASVEVVMSVRDSLTVADEGWANLRLRLGEVESFALKESPKASYQVLSNGLHVGHFEGLFFLDFGHYVDAPSTAAEYLTSEFYAAARVVEWEVIPYTEGVV